MMKRLLAGRGIFEHWQESDTEDLTDAEIPILQEKLDTEAKRRVQDGAVYTLNVSPDSYYGLSADYDFDTCVILKLAEKFEDWSFEAVNVTVPMAKR